MNYYRYREAFPVDIMKVSDLEQIGYLEGYVHIRDILDEIDRWLHFDLN